jgi:hypothetical protein
LQAEQAHHVGAVGVEGLTRGGLVDAGVRRLRVTARVAYVAKDVALGILGPGRAEVRADPAEDRGTVARSSSATGRPRITSTPLPESSLARRPLRYWERPGRGNSAALIWPTSPPAARKARAASISSATCAWVSSLSQRSGAAAISRPNQAPGPSMRSGSALMSI